MEHRPSKPGGTGSSPVGGAFSPDFEDPASRPLQCGQIAVGFRPQKKWRVWAPRSVTLNLVHISWKRCQCVGHMATLREIRLAIGQSQRAFAAQLEIPFQTYRPLDSGRRRTPTALLDRAAGILDRHRHDTELFTVDVLARDIHIHPRTLRAAARDGRLQVHFSNRAVFGRPLRLASRGAVDEFVQRFYRQRYSRFAPSLPQVPTTAVPRNFASRLIGLRLRLRISQGDLAQHIGAASKAVVSQWESRKRKPTIAFWSRIEILIKTTAGPGAHGLFERKSGRQQRGFRDICVAGLRSTNSRIGLGNAGSKLLRDSTAIKGENASPCLIQTVSPRRPTRTCSIDVTCSEG